MTASHYGIRFCKSPRKHQYPSSLPRLGPPLIIIFAHWAVNINSAAPLTSMVVKFLFLYTLASFTDELWQHAVFQFASPNRNIDISCVSFRYVLFRLMILIVYYSLSIGGDGLDLRYYRARGFTPFAIDCRLETLARHSLRWKDIFRMRRR